MKNDIRAWLELNGSYVAGMQLLLALREHNQVSQFVVELCQSGQSSFSFQRMKVELQKALLAMSDGTMPELKKAMVQKASIQPKAPPKKKGPVDVSNFPEDLQLLDKEIRALYKQNNIMRGQLRALTYTPNGVLRSYRQQKTTQSEREELCFAIATNQKHINEFWSQIDYYAEHGIRKPGTGPIDERRKVAEWLRDRPQMINYIRQAKCRYNKVGTYHDYDLYQKYINELSLIDKYLEEVL